jgi:hypothetical protein
MRLALIIGFLIVLLAPATASADPPLVDCPMHAEPSPPRPTEARWILAGPVAWPRVGADVFTRRPAGNVTVKRGISVDAGPTVTVRVLTRGAALIYRPSTRLAERPGEADRVLRFRACTPSTPLFSDEGTAGPRTGFPGAFVADRRKCVRVRVTAGGRSWHARIPVGWPCH